MSRMRSPLDDLSRRLKSGELTSLGLVDDALKEIRRRNGELNAFVEVFEEKALARARHLDRRRARGVANGELHGIPAAVKDIFDIASRATGFGSLAYSAEPAKTDADVIRQLESAGMIIVGVNSMVEFAFGAWGTNEALGTPRNPWDKKMHRVAGGSSSGSAVAVAAGLIPVAIGSDSGGSVRTPAALCGVVGLKPTYGTVSTRGVAKLTPSFDTVGVLANHVDDARRVLEVIGNKRVAAHEVNVSTLKVGRLEDGQTQPIDAEVAQRFRQSVAKLRDLGIEVETIRLPHSLLDYQTLCGVIMTREVYQTLKVIVQDKSRPVSAAVRARVMIGSTISDETYRGALANRINDIREFERATEGIDILLTPTTPVFAPLLSEIDEGQAPLSRFTRIVNYLNLCAITVPVRRAADEMPLGLQMIAKSGQDRILLAFAQYIERAV